MRKYPKTETIILYDKSSNNIIKVNLYYGTYKKYKKGTKKQVPFRYDELQSLCKLTEESIITKNFFDVV